MKSEILKSNKLEEVLKLLTDNDIDLIRHVENLILNEWQIGYDTGYKQAQSDANDWHKHNSHV